MFDLKSIYFNSAYLGPMPLRSRTRIEEALQQALDPAFIQFEERIKILNEVRARFAKLLGAPAENVAVSTSVSELVGHVANGIELHQGDNVVLMDGDYPSMILPWLVVAEIKGFQVRLLPRETFFQPELLESELNDRTRFVACSHVMFNTGLTLPIADLAKVCRKKEILFLADTSQSFGALAISPEIVNNVDILVGVAYKWLLGPYGSAYGYFSARALKEIRRTHASWLVSANSKSTESLLGYTTETKPGACRFDRGQSPAFLVNAGLIGALDVLLDQGLEQIEKHNMALAQYFLENLPASYSPLSQAGNISPIVCVKPQDEDASQVRSRLALEKIDVSLREGYLRTAFHFFNTRQQVDTLLSVLEN